MPAWGDANGGGGFGLTDALAVMRNGVEQLSSIAKSLATLATSPYSSATVAAASAASDSNGVFSPGAPAGFFEVKKPDGTVVEVPFYTKTM